MEATKKVSVSKLYPPEWVEWLRKNDLAFFAEDMLNMEVADVHKRWSQLVTLDEKLCIQAPRDHGKSFFFSFAYAIWRAYYNWIPSRIRDSKDFKSIPRVSIGYIFSNTQDQAIKLLDLVKREIEENPKLWHLIPEKKDVWSKTEIKLSNGAVIRARGWGVSVRGAHPVWIIADDCLNDESIYSELTRKKQIDYFFSAVTPMLVPFGQLVVVGTPFHQEDLYDKLRKNISYTFHTFPAINQKGEALWPTRYTKEALMKRKDEVGSTRFSREYLCVDEDTLVRTKEGYLAIKDITPEVQVLTHTGKWRAVKNVWKNELGDREVYEIKTSNRVGHIVTYGHKLLVTTTDYKRDVTKSKTDWVEVQDINARPSERIYLKCALPKYDGDLKISPELAYLAGWYVAEGHLASKAQQVTLSLGVKDNIAKIQECSKKEFGKEFQDYVYAQGCVQWGLNSKDAKTFMSLFGMGAKEKFVPNFMYWQTEDVKKSFLMAYFEGDGNFSKDQLRASSVSKLLILGVSDLLASVGIACSIAFKKSNARGLILGREVNLRDVWHIKICGSNYDMFMGTSGRRQSSSFIHGGFLYSRISSIKKITYRKKYVYDLEVEEDHSYVGIHGAFHNCNAVSDDASLFPDYIIERCFADIEMLPYITADEYKEIDVYMGVDLALSSTVGADYTVITTVGRRRKDGLKFLLDITRFKGQSMRDQLRTIQDVARSFKPLKIYVENNGFQRVFVDELVRDSGLPVEGFTTTAHAKNDASRGVLQLQVLFESGHFIIPRKTERCREKTDPLINELRAFSYVDGKLQGLGAHDDCVMSLWIAIECMNSGRFEYSYA